MGLGSRDRAWWLGAVAGRGLDRPWLLDVELSWYALVLAYRVLGPEGGAVGHQGEFLALSAVAGVCALAALCRWWAPHATAAIAFTVIVVGIVVILTRPPGPLGSLRLTMSLALVPILVAAVVRRSRPRNAAIAVVLAGVAASVDILYPGTTASVLLARQLQGAFFPGRTVVSLAGGIVFVLPIAVGLFLRNADAARRTAALDATRVAERLQVARELHDTVSNHVTGIIVTAQAAGLGRELAPATSEALHTIEGAGDRALAAMQRMVAALRAADAARVPTGDALAGLDPVPGDTTPQAAIRRAVDEGDAVRVRAPAEDGTLLDRDVATTISRVVTESLTNARRYSAAGAVVDVELSFPGPDRLVVEVTNPRGRARVRGGGFGLVGLRERVAAVGGVFEAGPVDGDHWRVRAELPVR